MKIYLSLAALSVAIGTTLGPMTPADTLPPELARYQIAPEHQPVVIRLANVKQAAARPAGS